MKKSEISMVKYTPGNKEAALELLGLLWTHLSKEDQKQLFEWRYEQNPYSDNPHIYLALTGKEVVAFRAFVMQPFVHPATGRLLTFTPADTIVHPTYRGQGLFKALNGMFFKDMHNHLKQEAIIFNLSSNEESTPANIKEGWQTTNGIKRFALNFSIRNYVMTKFFGQKTREPESGFSKTHFIEITHSPQPAAMALCAERYRDPHKLSHVRDTRYFNWRYALNKNNYLFTYLWQGEEILSYLVMEKRYDAQYLLLEYACRDGKVLKQAINLTMKKQCIPFLRTWALSDDDSSLLSRCGFIPAPVKLWKLLGKKRLAVLVRPIKEHPHPHDFFLGHIDTRDINNWQFFIADRH